MAEETVVDLSKVTKKDLEKVLNRNKQKLTALSTMGAGIDPTGVMARRLDLFLELFLDESQRLQFEYAFETRMSEVLDGALAQVRAAQLTAGVGQAVQQNPGLILPNGK